MDAKDTDIFISYRRVDGRDTARTIQLALGKEGFERVFFDYSSMREGMFNEQIITAINHCKDFILVLSPQSMLRCGDPEDWVARELQTAIEAGCKIIPVQVNEQFQAWPQDFPKKFNFIKQLQFLTLRNDEYFPDSIKRLIGWLDSKPTRALKTPKNFTLTVHTDETCELYVNGERIRKIKGGKAAVLNGLQRGQTYTLKLVSLAQRDSEMQVAYTCPEDGAQTGEVTVSFYEARQQKQQQAKQQQAAAARAREQAYLQEGRLNQARENYDKNGELSSGMVIVSLKGKIGYLNDNGFEAVACEYDDADDFFGDYATVCKNGKWGIIDKIGMVVIPFLSDTPCWSHKNYKYFIASRNQHFAIATISQGFPTCFPYDEVLVISGQADIFAVRNGELWSIIDVTGATSPFTLQTKQIGGYSECYKTFCKTWKEAREIETPMSVQQPATGRWGYLNSQLKLTIPFVDEGDGELCWEQKEVIIKTNGHMGLVDIESGEFIIPAIYDCIHDMHHGESLEYYRISDGGSAHECTRDKQGNITHEDKRFLWGGKQGVANSHGDFIVPQLYQYIHSHGDYEDDHPFFSAYILKDLQLSWEESSYSNRLSLHRQFDKEHSAIHIYASDGTIVRKIKYSEASQIWDIIRETMNKKIQ